MNPHERELAHVPRWCIVRTIRTQSVAEHAFFVARYAIDIATALGIPASSRLIEYCLKHDDEELHTGDIPAPYKKTLNTVENLCLTRGLTATELFIAKTADLLEAAMFLVDEELLGNRTVGVVLADLLQEMERYTAKYKALSGEYLSHWIHLRVDAHRSYRGRVK